MNRSITGAAIAGLLTACTSQVVNAPGNAALPNAPVNEETRPGVVRYLNQGIASVRERRRAHAYESMAEACGGAYRIVAEGERIDGGVVIDLGEDALLAPTQYWYIQFQCVEEDAE